MSGYWTIVILLWMPSAYELKHVCMCLVTKSLSELSIISIELKCYRCTHSMVQIDRLYTNTNTRTHTQPFDLHSCKKWGKSISVNSNCNGIIARFISILLGFVFTFISSSAIRRDGNGMLLKWGAFWRRNVWKVYSFLLLLSCVRVHFIYTYVWESKRERETWGPKQFYIHLLKHFMAYAIVEAIQFNYIEPHPNSAV